MYLIVISKLQSKTRELDMKKLEMIQFERSLLERKTEVLRIEANHI